MAWNRLPSAYYDSASQLQSDAPGCTLRSIYVMPISANNVRCTIYLLWQVWWLHPCTISASFVHRFGNIKINRGRALITGKNTTFTSHVPSSMFHFFDSFRTFSMQLMKCCTLMNPFGLCHIVHEHRKIYESLTGVEFDFRLNYVIWAFDLSHFNEIYMVKSQRISIA